MKRPVHVMLLLGALVACAALTAAGRSAAQDPDPLERRLQSVATLIERSSAARQIEASGEPAAREKRDNARLLHREASAMFKAGDSAGAARALDQAAREMMNGARLAKPEQITGDKQRADFEARLASTRALLAAQQRITQEKGNPGEAVAATQRIAALLAEAEGLAARGALEPARAPLERAYLMARVSIEAQRRGDTLVRALTFANKREEYEYELDRNDTHRMLIQVLLADRKEAASLMKGFVDRAGVLRGEAEARAQRGDHEAAIKGLEDSTRELVRAIRAGGIFIPG